MAADDCRIAVEILRHAKLCIAKAHAAIRALIAKRDVQPALGLRDHVGRLKFASQETRAKNDNDRQQRKKGFHAPCYEPIRRLWQRCICRNATPRRQDARTREWQFPFAPWRLGALALIACALLSAPRAQCAEFLTLVFQTDTITGRPLTNVTVTYTPLAAQYQSNRLIALNPVTFKTDYQGNYTTNIFPGNYRVEILHPSVTTPFTNCFSQASGTVYAADPANICVSVGANTNGLGLSVGNINAQFLRKTNSSGLSNDFTYPRLIESTNRTTNAIGQLWTATGTNGAGGWSNAPSSGISDATLVTASNALVALQSAADTLTSNGAVSFTMTVSNTLRSFTISADTTTSNGAVAFSLAASNAINAFYGNDFTGTEANVRSNSPTIRNATLTNGFLNRMRMTLLTNAMGVERTNDGSVTFTGSLGAHTVTIGGGTVASIGIGTADIIARLVSPFDQYVIHRTPSANTFTTDFFLNSAWSAETNWLIFPAIFRFVDSDGNAAGGMAYDGTLVIFGAEGANSAGINFANPDGTGFRLDLGSYGPRRGWRLYNLNGGGYAQGAVIFVDTNATEGSFVINGDSKVTFGSGISNLVDLVNLGKITNAGSFDNGGSARFAGPVTNLSTITNAGAVNNAAAVTNWGNTSLRGGIIDSILAFGLNTNFALVISNGGVLHLCKATNGLIGASIHSWNLTNGFEGIGTNAPTYGLHAVNSSVSGANIAFAFQSPGSTSCRIDLIASDRTGSINAAPGGGGIGTANIQLNGNGGGIGDSTSGLSLNNANGTIIFGQVAGDSSSNLIIGAKSQKLILRAPAGFPIALTNDFGVGTTLPSSSIDSTGQVRGASSVWTNGVYFPSNSVAATAIEANLANGGWWQGAISNKFVVAWKTNSVTYWTNLFVPF